MAEYSIAGTKQALRAAMLSQRGALTEEISLAAGNRLQAKAIALPVYATAHAVVLYSAIQNEIPTERIRDHALAQGKKVLYPKLTGMKSVAVAEIRSAADFATGRLGILEPVGTALGDDMDACGLVVFLPGLAFDAHGNRLGRGAGWYDRLLHRLGTRAVCVGLAYEFQVIGAVPTEPWDEKIDYVVTENRVIACGRHRRDRRRSLSQCAKGGVL